MKPLFGSETVQLVGQRRDAGVRMKRKPEARLDQTREVVEGHERLQLFTKASRTEEIPNQAVVRSPDAMDNLALCRPGVGAGGAKESSAAGQAAPTTKAPLGRVRSKLRPSTRGSSDARRRSQTRPGPLLHGPLGVR